MKNKIICLIFAMALVIGMLASCSGNGDSKKDPDAKRDWEETTILYQLTENTNGDELSSGCARYYSGRDSKGEQLDDLVSDRNDAAYASAKVKVDYSYLPNDGDHNWGDNTNNIFKQATAGGQSNPDIFCNFAYDMTCAAIKGSFANLYSTSYDSNKNTTAENYFRFTEADYNPDLSDPESFFDSSIAEGYFKAYMDSLSLSEGKAYCLASDYCTDLVRAFLVVPVNVKLLSEIPVTEEYKAKGVVDIKNDGVYDTYDFYEMVWDYEWTYDMIATLSAGIYQNKNTTNDTAGATTNLGDRIGFAAGTGSGLTGSGLLYTTDVKIINRADLSYPAENGTLNQIASALYNLFYNGQNKGVCTISSTEAKAAGYDSLVGPELIAIRSEFAKNNILFGGVITVGSLEDSVYQGMKPSNPNEVGGFGIVPVPMYKSGLTYRTLVHNLARIVGISVVTDEFEQCTAFLDDVSRNSAEVLNEYYTVNLAAVVGGGTAGQRNIDMLNYIRNHVNDCFDKTFEDMVSFYKQTDDAQTWHKILDGNSYMITDMSGIYGQNAVKKNAVLKEIVAAWENLQK